MPASPPGTAHRATNQPNNQPWVEIIEQPSSKSTRFRYESENQQGGVLSGTNSTKEKQTHPTIKVHNHNGACVVVVSLVTHDDGDKPKPHPHTLVGPECRQGVCTKKVKQNLDCIQFPNLGIQCTKKADLKGALTLRQQIRVDPFLTGFDHMEKPQLKTINLMVVKLCFQVFLPDETGKYQRPVPAVCSEPIQDKKSAGELSIHSYLPETCPVAGGEQMILLTGKLPKADELEVRFYEGRHDEPDWEGFGTFTQKDIHQSVALTIKIPEYTRPITNPSRHKLQVMMELRKKSNPEDKSQPRHFFYHIGEPVDQENISVEADSLGDSGGSAFKSGENDGYTAAERGNSRHNLKGFVQKPEDKIPHLSTKASVPRAAALTTTAAAISDFHKVLVPEQASKLQETPVKQTSYPMKLTDIGYSVISKPHIAEATSEAAAQLFYFHEHAKVFGLADAALQQYKSLASVRGFDSEKKRKSSSTATLIAAETEPATTDSTPIPSVSGFGNPPSVSGCDPRPADTTQMAISPRPNATPPVRKPLQQQPQASKPISGSFKDNDNSAEISERSTPDPGLVSARGNDFGECGSTLLHSNDVPGRKRKLKEAMKQQGCRSSTSDGKNPPNVQSSVKQKMLSGICGENNRSAKISERLPPDPGLVSAGSNNLGRCNSTSPHPTNDVPAKKDRKRRKEATDQQGCMSSTSDGKNPPKDPSPDDGKRRD